LFQRIRKGYFNTLSLKSGVWVWVWVWDMGRSRTANLYPRIEIMLCRSCFLAWRTLALFSD